MKVNYVVGVPDGKYCWDWKSPGSNNICNKYDNEGGHSECSLGFYPLKRSKDGVLKPDECLSMKEV